MEFKIGDHVKHRAWKYKGIVTDVPFEQKPFDNIIVKWEGKEKEEEAWIPAIMLDDEEEIDWSEWLG